LLEKDRNRDVQTACMMALAKIGRAPQGVDLEALFVARLARDNQEVRETAALALGVAGRPAAVAPLLALVRDEPAGRTLCERAKVDDRTRAFAAYGLGLLARQSDDAAVKLAAHDALWALLAGDEAGRDLRVAAANAMGVLVDPERLRIEIFRRGPSPAEWSYESLSDGQALVLKSLDVSLEPRVVFENVVQPAAS
jgi:hypothetical protein